MSGGWSPSVHLTCHMGARPVWDEAHRRPSCPAPGAVPGMAAAGAAAGRFSTAAASRTGAAAGEALADLGLAVPPVELPEAEDAPVRRRLLGRARGAAVRGLPERRDRQGHPRSPRRRGSASVEHMKRYTTLGMATDQGKTANVPGIAVLAELPGARSRRRGRRPSGRPIVPVPIAAYGAGGQGVGFAPQRLHRLARGERRAGRAMIEAGLWYRAALLPAAGRGRPGARAATARCAMVRGAVGVCDVSTLGKIDIQGPDAGALPRPRLRQHLLDAAGRARCATG